MVVKFKTTSPIEDAVVKVSVCKLVNLWLYSEDMHNIVIHIPSWAIISQYVTKRE